jgi:hypothetical protein
MGGAQTPDERVLADRIIEILKIIPGQTCLTACANLNSGVKKSDLVTTEQVFRACASDQRIFIERDPNSGLARYYLKEPK